ncbi:MAG: NTP transferase domain-containing protein [Candidatus Omnitrophica bacterium]|nr:NTP transferase domain-containing protein [Candidatus Omnitrophota bacterium]MBU1924674.1 NTP transferase domain-containing protein [Candidatus Omnitrophota bacterium]
MMKNETAAVILAAGEGTRMNSNYPKILHKLGAKPLLGYVIDNVHAVGIKKIFVITGFKSKLVKEHVGTDAKCIEQKKLLGTADAVWQIRNEAVFKNRDARLLVIYGDTPLVSSVTIKRLVEQNLNSEAAVTLLTVRIKDPSGYGRIIRNERGEILKIIEEQEANVYERATEEVNVGVYIFKSAELFKAIKQIKPDNKKKEYYLTDVVEIMRRNNSTIDSVETDDADEILGINSRFGLVRAYKIFRNRVIKKIVESGVTVLDPETTFIDENVQIGKETIIYPFTVIERDVVIGGDCSIGPFCRIRSGCRISDDVIVGNFVELNRTQVAGFTRIKHQSYLGDTIVGEKVNIGAGTIVANYDGKNKHKTFIDKNAFIGSGTILVAPVKIGSRAVTGAGAVVPKNKNVPAGTIVVGIPAKKLNKKKR